MKKSIIGLSLFLAMSFTVPAIAAGGSDNKQNCKASENCPLTECPCPAQCAPENCAPAYCNGRPECKKDRKDRHHKHGRHDKKGRKGFCKGDSCRPGADGRFAAFLFDGIQLTDDQKAGIKTLNERVKAERKNFTDATKARVKAEKQKMREESKKKYDAGVKDILTAEQYAKYQENSLKMQAKQKECMAAKKIKKAERSAVDGK